MEIIAALDDFAISHISREENVKANDLAQQASGYQVSRGKLYVLGQSVLQCAEISMAGPDDWRRPIIRYLEDPSQSVDRKVRRQALKYTLLDGELYRRTPEGLLLKCLGPDQSKVAMGEVNEGICGTHQSAHKMKWLLRRAGFYWSTMLEDSFRYYKGCDSCQKFGDIQLAHASMLHPIIKPWPFRGWGLDFIGQIHPKSSKGHRFVLVATDYFTK